MIPATAAYEKQGRCSNTKESTQPCVQGVKATKSNAMPHSCKILVHSDSSESESSTSSSTSTSRRNRRRLRRRRRRNDALRENKTKNNRVQNDSGVEIGYFFLDRSFVNKSFSSLSGYESEFDSNNLEDSLESQSFNNCVRIQNLSLLSTMETKRSDNQRTST